MAHQRSPAEGIENHERDLFWARLDEMIGMIHSLVRVSQVMPWEALVEEVGVSLPQIPVGPGRRPLPARLVLGLLEHDEPDATMTVLGKAVFYSSH